MTYETHKKRPRRNWRRGRVDSMYKDKASYGRVEKMFWYYNRIKRALAEMKDETGYYKSGYKDGGGSSNHAFISDPTAQLAMKHMRVIPKLVFEADTPYEDVVEQPESWIIVVDQTFQNFIHENVVREVLRRRYLRNEPMPTTCIDMEISEGRYYRARDAGLSYARDCAIQLGLITVFECPKETSKQLPKRNCPNSFEPIREPLTRKYEDCSY